MKKETYFGSYCYDIPDHIEEAKLLAEKARLEDPFPQICPSLLNKHDIIKYVSKTGMIFPFSERQLKPASCEVNVGVEFFRWIRNQDGSLSVDHKRNLSKYDKIPFIRNSITFVDVDATFYIPFYIALRFNLSITHVHRGLLLGTGPLIDPGFCGKIMIPIHNLTNNDYYLRPGEPLIAVEFTKLTPDEILSEDIIKSFDRSQVDLFYGKKIKDKDLSFMDFLTKALPNGVPSVESSIGIFINDAGKKVSDAEGKILNIDIKANEMINKIDTRSKIISTASVLALIAIFVSVVGLFVQVKNVVSSANKYVSDTKDQFRSDMKTMSEKIDSLSSDIFDIKNKKGIAERIDDTTSVDKMQKINDNKQ